MGADEPLDSATDWVAERTRAYVESNGDEGYLWRGFPTIVLTTRGRKSGNLRRNALIYGRDGDDYVLIASYGGRPKHPLWYLNLVAEPQVHLQVGAESFDARARTATAEEKPRLWNLMAAIFPQYDRYQKKTACEIPVVILETRDS